MDIELREERKVFVLKDGDKYFREWTGIGPACTKKIFEAAQFDTKEDAMRSPAFTFSLTSFEPKEVTITNKSK